MSISAPAPSSSHAHPRAVHGLVYGVLVSAMMWAAIGFTVYELMR